MAVTERSGSVIAATIWDGELAAWRETDNVAKLDPSEVPTPPEVPYEWVERDDENTVLAIGDVYAMRVGTHCGIVHLAQWEGVDWWVRDGWRYPEGVDYLNQAYYGTVERVEEELIVFTVGEVVYAEYQPRDERFIC